MQIFSLLTEKGFEEIEERLRKKYSRSKVKDLEEIDISPVVDYTKKEYELSEQSGKEKFGMLSGKVEENKAEIDEIVPVPESLKLEEKEKDVYLSSRALKKYASQHKDKFLVIYHTHPDVSEPTETDIEFMWDNVDAVYVILGPKGMAAFVCDSEGKNYVRQIKVKV